MNWDFVKNVVEHKAHAYALEGGKNAPGSPVYAQRYNGYYSGYIENASERESLRAILKLEESKVLKTVDDNRSTLDSLV
jgi:hypothetical protein